MYYTYQGNTILIRVPKAASSTTVAVLTSAFGDLQENGPVHETYAELRERVNSSLLEDRPWRVIAFVRHPIPWFNSIVSYFWEGNGWADKFWNGPLKRFDGPNREAQLLVNMTHTPRHWMLDKDGKMAVTDVYRVEDMKKFSESLMVPYQHVGETPKTQRIALNWTKEQLDVLRERFAWELQYYPEGL